MIARRILAPILATALLLSACSDPQTAAMPAHGEQATADYERGPHRGRMLRDGDFALELQIFEDGVPPEYHAYLYRDDQALPPDAAKVTVELTRLGDRIDRFEFEPRGDYLLGDGTVVEPHSFSVAVSAIENGKTHRWAFDSFEGRVTILEPIARDAGIGTEIAGPATIADTLLLNGRVVPNEERVARVGARYPGLIRSVAKTVGDSVSPGDTLASVESNDSLQRYAVTAPVAGIVIERHANAGEVAGEEPLFVVADYRSLWVELSLFPRDLARVQAGLPVRLRSVDGELETQGTISRVAPAEGEAHGMPSGIYNARVVLDNAEGRWMPGMFVQGAVQIGETPVPLAVKRSGLQGFRDFTVVFEQIGETYEVRMLELGRQDETWVEVLGGLQAGARYVTDNSYLIKADIEKSGASHDH
ncbi:efflux RND transporter periplasmic adaptor subunit [Algiphilus sp. W345]|uniref:Efflux RND transporter periplasmic adaptor subunit n=1 Tax=Banduia mediterranea TaxID=3075609 RepID=A0ABU2WMY3_9GAMM|nr:efflux RND transporter periplasmic adaptor subunit [Algiphilus sp. W345]MDT0499217.1 efflux RND transporter periplasmic adaptor subunit [Algiphilus sp. W345]